MWRLLTTSSFKIFFLTTLKSFQEISHCSPFLYIHELKKRINVNNIILFIHLCSSKNDQIFLNKKREINRSKSYREKQLNKEGLQKKQVKIFTMTLRSTKTRDCNKLKCRGIPLRQLGTYFRDRKNAQKIEAFDGKNQNLSLI